MNLLGQTCLYQGIRELRTDWSWNRELRVAPVGSPHLLEDYCLLHHFLCLPLVCCVTSSCLAASAVAVVAAAVVDVDVVVAAVAAAVGYDVERLQYSLLCW